MGCNEKGIRSWWLYLSLASDLAGRLDKRGKEMEVLACYIFMTRGPKGALNMKNSHTEASLESLGRVR